MTRNCLFCPSTNLTREHIYPEWLLSEYTPSNQFFTPEVTTQVVEFQENAEKYQAKNISSDGRKINYTDFVTKSVCDECNNGWMSRLESKAQNILGNFPSNVFDLNFEQASTLSQWAILKTILISSSAQVKSEWSKSTLETLKLAIIPDGFLVEIVTLKSSALDFRIGNQTISIPKYLSKDELELAVDCFFIGSLQIRNIGFRVSHLRSNLAAYRAQIVEKIFVSYPFSSSQPFLPECSIFCKEDGGQEKILADILTIDHLHSTLAIYG